MGMLWKSQRYTYWDSLKVLFSWMIVLLIIEAIDQAIFGNNLFVFGVRQGDFAHWYRIFFAPFLHENFAHALNNAAGLLFLGSLILLLGWKTLLTVTFASVVVSGVGLLFFGGTGVHAGASSVVYGYFGFLVFRGIYERCWKAILLGAIVLFIMQFMLVGLLPGTPGLSWKGHVFGFLGGISAAATLARERRRKRSAKPAFRASMPQ